MSRKQILWLQKEASRGLRQIKPLKTRKMNHLDKRRITSVLADRKIDVSGCKCRLSLDAGTRRKRRRFRDAHARRRRNVTKITIYSTRSLVISQLKVVGWMSSERVAPTPRSLCLASRPSTIRSLARSLPTAAAAVKLQSLDDEARRNDKKQKKTRKRNVPETTQIFFCSFCAFRD
jgi:hypothetical protein